MPVYTIDSNSTPELRLALACALWADLCQLDKNQHENELRENAYQYSPEAGALREEVVTLIASVHMPTALEVLRKSAAIRQIAIEGIQARGLPVVDAHAFGEGWAKLGSVALC